MKNKVQFQKGYSLIDFMNDYGTEEKCRNTTVSVALAGWFSLFGMWEQ